MRSGPGENLSPGPGKAAGAGSAGRQLDRRGQLGGGFLPSARRVASAAARRALGQRVPGMHTQLPPPPPPPASVHRGGRAAAESTKPHLPRRGCPAEGCSRRRWVPDTCCCCSSCGGREQSEPPLTPAAAAAAEPRPSASAAPPRGGRSCALARRGGKAGGGRGLLRALPSNPASRSPDLGRRSRPSVASRSTLGTAAPAGARGRGGGACSPAASLRRPLKRSAAPRLALGESGGGTARGREMRPSCTAAAAAGGFLS